MVYTGMLNSRGGYEADVTVTRVSHDAFSIVTATAQVTRDIAWIKRHTEDLSATVTDMTSSTAVIGVFGPRSRTLLEMVSDADLSNDGFPFGTSRPIGVGYHMVEAKRITYVGELGWELHVPVEAARGVYDTLHRASQEARVGLRDCGYYTIDGLRIEKGYRAWSHELSPDLTPLEAGLGFTVSWDKPGGFLGQDALKRQREEGITKRCFSWILEDPTAMVWGDEPLRMNGEIVGTASSVGYGHTVGASDAVFTIVLRALSHLTDTLCAFCLSVQSVSDTSNIPRWPRRASRSRARSSFSLETSSFPQPHASRRRSIPNTREPGGNTSASCS